MTPKFWNASFTLSVPNDYTRKEAQALKSRLLGLPCAVSATIYHSDIEVRFAFSDEKAVKHLPEIIKATRSNIRRTVATFRKDLK